MKTAKKKYVSGVKHPRFYRNKIKHKIIALVVKNPTLGLTEIAKKVKSGRHAVYSTLKDLKLTTVTDRVNFSKLYENPRVLDRDIKISAVRKVFANQESVGKIALSLNVARKTVYCWVSDFEKEGNVNTDYVKGFEHPKSLGKNFEDRVLSEVVKNPSLSVHSLARELNHNSHGVYNVLKRNNLNFKYEREAYARTHSEFITTPVSSEYGTNGVFDRVRSVLPSFTPNLSPAPPPIALLKLFLASSAVSSVFFYTLLQISSFGMVLAYIALMAGMFFFIYSLKYYLTLGLVLSYSQKSEEKVTNKNFVSWILGKNQDRSTANSSSQAAGLNSDMDGVLLKDKPFVSVHIALFNEKNVVERIAKAATNFNYPAYEVILADDSSDETTNLITEFQKKYLFKNEKLKETRGEGWILREVEVRPNVFLKHLHRVSRDGYKGKALELALKLTDPRAKYISIFDADFVPYPDSLELFLKYFQEANNNKIAVVQGYQWHVLNKSENWITRGVRSEYAGSYVIERSGAEIYGGLKQISGSVYMIKRDALAEIGWGTSITEDFELTLKLYEKGYKVLYTPYIQAPAECVGTLKRLIRQRMRWAEGHSFNVKKMFKKLMLSSNLTKTEKLEFLYLAPYYLQAFFFLLGTFCWLLSETVFRVRLPFWSEVWGWSLILTNMIALPLVNGVGLFMEESEQKDYTGLSSFVALSYIVVPFQAYAAVKGFIEKEEGPWFRTPKTGRITDLLTRGRFMKFVSEIIPGVSKAVEYKNYVSPYLALSTASNPFDNFKITKKKARWVGKASLAVLLIISNLIISMAPSVPYFVKPKEVQAQSFGVLGDGPKDAKPVSEFPNGVLALNTNKSFYKPNETAKLMIGALDSKGDTLCNAELTLNIYSPDQQIKVLKTKLGTINKSVTCSPDNNVTDSPDYFVNYKVGKSGIYSYDLINNENGYQISGTFEVKKYSPVTIERTSATRINPFKSSYVMKIKVTANENITGIIKDVVPENFEIQSGATSMKVNIKKGQSKTFEYTYQSPKISPNLYNLGPIALEIGISSTPFESHSWMIASDASITSSGTGTFEATAWPNTLRTGTITTSNVSTAITGTSTLFTTEINKGNIIKTTGNVAICTVASVTDNTHLTCVSNAASTNTNISYNVQGVGPGDAVTITTTHNVTLTSNNNTVASLTFGTAATAAILTVNSGLTLTVTGALSVLGNVAAGTAGTIQDGTGAGTVTAGSLSVGSTGTTTLNNAATLTLFTSTISTLTVSGALGTNCQTNGTSNRKNTTTVDINAGSTSFGGTITLCSTGMGADFLMNQGAQTGTVTSTAATPWATVTAPATATLNGTGATFKYTASGTQTALATTYTNLTLGGTSAKTLTSVTVNGTLRMQGTATASVAPTYGAAAALVYDTASNVTAGPEWLATFAATGGVTIANTGIIKLNNAKTFNASVILTINNGATLDTDSVNNYALTFNDDFVNNGTLTGNASPVTIAGTKVTQSIGGFTTTGTVSMTKTAGTATLQGNVNGGAFTMNGTGGTLNLGTSLTHTFTGTFTMTAGTLTASSSTLKLGGTMSGSGITFNANTGTVEFNAAGAQTVPVFSYNNLTLSNSGAKTMTSVATIGGNLTITGSATMTGNAAFTVTGTLTYSSSGSTTLTSAASISIGKFSQSSGTLNDNGNTIVVTGTGASTWTISGGTFTTSGTANFAGTAPQIGLSNFNNLTINVGSANTATATGNITVAGTLNISSGTFSAGSNTINVAGNFTNGGAFTAGTSTVNLNGAGGSTQTISGTNTFYTLTATGSSARTIKFPSGVTTIVTNSLTLSGATSQLLSLSPSTAATTWYITPPATQSISFVNVTYSDATTCISASSSSGSNNSLWNLAGGSCFSPTSFSFQRKTWYDGTRFWRAYQDTTNSRIRFDYSTNSGSSWTEDTSAQVAVNTYDFSIEATSTNAFIVYTTSNDTRGRIASSYPGTGFSWGAETTIFNGTGTTDDYSLPVISRDSSNIVWVGARYLGSGTYLYKTIHHPGAANTLPQVSGDTVYTLGTGTNKNVYGTIVSIGSQNMYSTFVTNTTLAGCKWVNASTAWQNTSGMPCSSGTAGVGTAVKINDASNFGTLDNVGARQIVRTSGGNLYTVPGDNCQIWKSTNNGTSWSQMDSGNVPAGCTRAAIAIDGSNNIHMAYISTVISYVLFTTSTDTYGTPEPVSSLLGNSSYIGISVDSNTKPHVVWDDNSPGAGTSSVNYSNKVGASWLASQSVAGDPFVTGAFISISIAINASNIPEISYVWSSSNEMSASIGSANNPSTWSTQILDSTININANQTSVSLAVDSSGNTWVAYVDASTNYITLVEHLSADAWSTWQTAVTHSNAGYEPSLAINGTDVYVFYQRVSDSHIVVDSYSGGTWNGETNLETGTYKQVQARWSYNNNTSYSSNGIEYIFSDGVDIYENTITLGSVDSIATIASGFTTTISSVSDGTNVHLVYVDSSNNTIYKEYTGSWQTGVTLDGNGASLYPSISLDTSTNNVYAFWIRSDHAYYSSASSPYTSWAAATDWHTGTNLTYLTSSASTNGYVFAEWASGSSQPYSINWDVIAVPENLWLLFSLGIIVPIYLKKKRRFNSDSIIQKL